LLIYLQLRDVEHLHSAMLSLEAESHVAAIERFRDPAAAQVAVEYDR
jgi:guanosine-3',5'-bis(diphosphate) 3'-pyrophosphohydrolase